jgi:hypothetical protein
MLMNVFSWDVMMGVVSTIFVAWIVARFGRQNMKDQLLDQQQREDRANQVQARKERRDRLISTREQTLIPLRTSLAELVAEIRATALVAAHLAETKNLGERVDALLEAQRRFNSSRLQTTDSEVTAHADSISELIRTAMTADREGGDSERVLDRLDEHNAEIMQISLKLMRRIELLLNAEDTD